MSARIITQTATGMLLGIADARGLTEESQWLGDRSAMSFASWLMCQQAQIGDILTLKLRTV